jgi:CRP-like cAMP-binding protein
MTWLTERITGALTETRYPKTAADIAESVPGATRGQVYAALAELARAGVVTHAEPEGSPRRWALAEHGKG